MLQDKMLGKKQFQPFFQKLYHLSKFGRNIGLPIDVRSSGEIAFIKAIGNKWKEQKEFIFFDIGANHGIYTEAVLTCIPGNKRCYLFEPQSALCKELSEKFARNDNITVIEKGCGNENG